MSRARIRAHPPSGLPRIVVASEPEIRQGGRWFRFSSQIRRERPTCELCRRRVSQEVHHVVPVSEDPTRCFDRENVLAVCRPCHRGTHAHDPTGGVANDGRGGP
jgi:hypothetical protein